MEPLPLSAPDHEIDTPVTALSSVAEMEIVVVSGFG